MSFRRLVCACLFLLLALSGQGARADTLDDVLARGFVRCGINEDAPGFSSRDDVGERIGFLVDLCRTVSAAVFGRMSIEYLPVTPQTSFISLQTGRIDMLAAGANWTFVRDVTLGLDFAGIILFHSQGFLVRKSSGIRSVADLDTATICVTQGTTMEQNLADWFDARHMRYNVVTFARIELAAQAYDAGRCDAVTTEQIPLFGHLSNLNDPGEHTVLAEVISTEPTGVVVRQNETRWHQVVRWSLNVLLLAEELCITQANVDVLAANATDRDVRLLLGLDGELGAQLGLPDSWAHDVIRLVGNYNDSWQRNFARWHLPRGINALRRDGGLLTAVPLR